jgi:hypothetical protein
MKRISLIAIIGILLYLVALPMGAAQASTKATHPGLSHFVGTKVKYKGTKGGKITVKEAVKSLSQLKQVKEARGTGPDVAPSFHAPSTPKPLVKGKTAKKAPTTATKPISGRSKPGTAPQSASPAVAPTLLHGWNGISTASSTADNTGLTVTPPDQGICVGALPLLPHDPTVVFEVNNLELRLTTSTGVPILDTSLATWFDTAGAFGDVRCLYDSTTHEFLFTEIGIPGGFYEPSYNQSVDDVAVLGSFGLVDFAVSSNETTNCLGDQPKSGFDGTSLFISTDEYCGPGLTSYGGALVNVIGLSYLPYLAFYEPIQVPTVGGLTALGLDPAIGTPGHTGYMVNSFAYATPEFTVEYTTSNLLGVFSINTTYLVDDGYCYETFFFCSSITGLVIGSESYAFPVAAKSTDTTNLNPDDDRTSGPVTVTVTGGKVNLWTAVTTALLQPGGTPYTPTAFTDGAAWFEVSPSKSQVEAQGYLGIETASLIYPAVAAVQNGAIGLVGTITATWLTPSASFTNIGSPFVYVTQLGNGPSETFAYRWGDYSFDQAAFGGAIWMATEYIPPSTTWVFYTTTHLYVESNWGTYVWEEAP